MLWIYEAIQKHDIDAESQALLEEGHKDILQANAMRIMAILLISELDRYTVPVAYQRRESL